MRVNDHRSISDEARLRMAFVAGHVGMTAMQGEMRAGLMVESRRNPALRIVAIGAGGFPGFCELPGMHVFVTVLADL